MTTNICSKLGIRYFSNHKFRFRWVSDCYEAGVEEERIQNSVGHAGAEMTRHYNRSRVRPLTREEVDAITAGAFTTVHYK
ncbi:MAG: tyrosine-type recombinase/integrase [Lachnospiraceae bacterium]|nr:tyrosine-type recombinase/integrase [Lachnospiraceae bacterium]